MISKKSIIPALAAICFVLVSCAPKNKVVVMAPSESSGSGIVYKSAPDAMNEMTGGFLLTALKNLSSGFFTTDLQASPFLCGPVLWNQLKSSFPADDSIGVAMTILIPNLDPDGNGKTQRAEGRVIREEKDHAKFFVQLESFLNTTDTFTIRKLTDIEKSIYWAFISWDIEEPVFAVEAGEKVFIADLTKYKDAWTLIYFDEISALIEKSKSARRIAESREKVHEMAKTDNLAGAKAEALKSVEESGNLYGKKHTQYGMSLVNLANVYSQERMNVEAESVYVEAANVFIGAPGINSIYLVGIYNNLSSLYGCQSRYEEAELVLKKAIHICESIEAGTSKQTPILYSSLAINYKNQKNYTMAVQTHQTVVKMFEKEFGVDNPNNAIAYSNFGECYFEMQDYDQADIWYRKAETVLVKSLGANHGMTIGILANKARNQVYLKRYSEAKPLLLHAIEYRMQKEGRINRSILEPVESLGKLYRETGDLKKAEEYEAWAEEIEEQTKGGRSCTIVPLQ